MKNNYNFGCGKFYLKFNQGTKHTHICLINFKSVCVLPKFNSFPTKTEPQERNGKNGKYKK